ncbi:hypothetical protein N482_13310 [Pseudoalteromonas luteoviolacea NCIMB 1942]|uniref:Uncharacterized protein n=1 Tax=Pseudoalteromonas luteoviolacea NCIMB 1942 TaxID=1365253 RepID=A0A167B134_9GAMM|nr:hypothetical protein N482_13310 [Pseudoalteromonas luteoviolacea NCIMB 1942]
MTDPKGHEKSVISFLITDFFMANTYLFNDVIDDSSLELAQPNEISFKYACQFIGGQLKVMANALFRQYSQAFSCT